jgi:DMSO/TMAO reductase YedYZ molybdopterin-dependent catalytic subunit
MKANTKKLVAITTSVVIILAAVVAVYYFTQAGAKILPDGEPPQWQVTVSGNVEQEKTVTLKEISEMPLTTVVTKTADGKNITYQGVTLFDFCNRTGMLWDAGPINVISSTGQKATLNIFQAWNSTVYPYFQDTNRIALVFVKNGQWMTNENGGPLLLVSPHFSNDYQIEHVSEVNIEMWTVSISGAVEDPITINSKNMTAIQDRTVEAEFVPGSGKRTSNWTGLPIMNLLEAANVSYSATKIVVVAVDDYSRNYTLREIQEAQMMLGYKENYVPLSQDQGGPFRLVLPVDKYKWAQFWVKFVNQIIVY